MRIALHTVAVLLLSVLTQLGGIAWLLALFTRSRVIGFVLIYAVLSTGALFVAPLTGRVPLPCFGSELRVQTPLLCVMNRHYVTPQMRDVAVDLSAQMARAHDGTTTVALDGNFPFFDDFPLLPHLSHDDGEKLDFALYWQDGTGTYQRGRSRSPVGYWGYVAGPSDCTETHKDLRWDMAWLQSLRADWQLDLDRQRDALRHLARDTRVSKILIEPHLEQALGVASGKIRFQGCRAARHDDHIHIQL